VKPLPAALVTGPPLLAAIAAWSPLWLAAATIGAALLLAAAPPPRRLYAVTAIASGLVVFAINPFVSVQGLTVLWQGPHIPILDTQVTVEEVAYGAGAGMRVAASALAVAAFVRLADPDLLLRAFSRVAPRSAMIAALATRMLPTLERDAAGIVTAARTRAARVSRPRTAAGLLGPLLASSLERSLSVAEAMVARGYGSSARTRALERDAVGIVTAARTRAARMTSPRAAAGLLGPLLASSLERSLSVAEAMEARGYGSPARTRAPERATSAREWALAGLGGCALALVVAALIGGVTDFRYYDTLGDPWQPAAMAGAGLLLALLGTAAAVVRWPR